MVRSATWGRSGAATLRLRATTCPCRSAQQLWTHLCSCLCSSVVGAAAPLPQVPLLAELHIQWRASACTAWLQGDIAAGKMIFGVEGVDPERRER